ncbi:hypothetical protein JCM11251_001475 [Rhodosporidiobolus azoricus]
MRSSLDTNTLPPDLAARFAALRAPSAPVSASPDTAPTSPSRDNKGNVDDFTARLARLETPVKGDKEGKVPVQVKTPDGSFGASKDDEDDAVTAFLLSTASSSPPPTNLSFSPTRSASYRHKLPLPSPSALDTLSGIEVQFIKRPSLGGPGFFGEDGGLGEGGEEEDLMRRMREEMEIEGRVKKRDQEGVGEWEKRMEGLKGVVPSAGGPSSSAVGGLRDAPPRDVGELEGAMKRRVKRREKKKQEGVSDEEETSSEKETTTEEDEKEEETDSEKGSEEER